MGIPGFAAHKDACNKHPLYLKLTSDSIQFALKCMDICGKQWQQPLMNSRLLSLSFVGCYAKNFGPKGFGYGQGAGALVHAQ